MREVLVVQIGTSGNRVGNQYFNRLAQEHHLQSDHQLGNFQTYFSETNSSYFARAVLIDTDSNALDQILQSKSLYSPNTFISINGAQRNNYAYAFNEFGFVTELALDAVRQQAEVCESFQGFEVIHSLVGGCGSGLGARIVSQLSDDYPNRALQSQIIAPPSLSESVLEPYNFVLGIQSIMDKSSLIHLYDNKALYSILIKNQKIKNPGFQDLNDVISRSLSGNSCGFRFAGQINSSFLKQEVNLVPFPKINFILNSTSALPTSDRIYQTEEELYYMLMHQDMVMASVSINKHKFFTMHIQNRGSFPTSQTEYSVLMDRKKMIAPNMEYIPDKIKISYSDHQVDGQKRSATMQINSLAVGQLIHKQVEEAEKMFKRKAFIYQYEQYGIDLQSMEETIQACFGLKSEYEQYADDGDLGEGEEYE